MWIRRGIKLTDSTWLLDNFLTILERAVCAYTCVDCYTTARACFLYLQNDSSNTDIVAIFSIEKWFNRHKIVSQNIVRAVDQKLQINF